MGRLFWKFFLAFWVSVLVAGAGVGTVVWLHKSAEPGAEEGGPPPGGQHTVSVVRGAAIVLTHAGLDALRTALGELERDRPISLRVVGADGQEAFGREVTPEMRARAERNADSTEPLRYALRVTAGDGRGYLVFAPPELAPPRPLRHGPPPSPWVPIVAGLIASLAFSALAAWYLSKPIRHLRWAFGAAATGRLETRVQPLMGSRRDEIADLGHDFDRMAQQLQMVVGAQRRLLHDVSHELRSPLARMQAAIGLARQSPQKVEASLERIERESQRLDLLVGELLTLSRLEAGTQEVPREQIDIVDLLASIAEDARYEAQASGRDLSFCGEGELNVEGSPEMLHRAFENVIRNAVKYTHAGTTVEVRIDDRGRDGLAHVVVSDHGPGVAQDELQAIFEPFYRGGNCGAASGVGLGLAIARRAVQSHGGTIEAHIRPEGGLLIEIALPVAHSAQSGGVPSAPTS